MTTSFFNPSATRLDMFDGLESFSFDQSDTGDMVQSSLPSSVATSSFDMAAKSSNHHSHAYSYGRLEPVRQDSYQSYDTVPDDAPMSMPLQDSESMHPQYNAHIISHNTTANSATEQYTGPLGQTVFDNLGTAYSESFIMPHVVGSHLDGSFMESSFTDSNINYPNHFPDLDNQHDESHTNNINAASIQQPIPQKPVPVGYRPHAYSFPQPTASSILTPLSAVADEQWNQVPTSAPKSGQFHVNQSPFDDLGHSMAQASFQRSIPNAMAHNVLGINNGQAYTRTPESPMGRLRHRYSNSTNKAQAALSKAKPVAKSLRNNSNPQYNASNSSTHGTSSGVPSKPSSSKRVSTSHSNKAMSAVYSAPVVEKSTKRNERKEPPLKRDPSPRKPIQPPKGTATSSDGPPVKKKHKRLHTQKRSRFGCWICRIKHLKCDEVRPACTHCRRFGVACDYDPERPTYVSDKELRRKKLEELSAVRKGKRRRS